MSIKHIQLADTVLQEGQEFVLSTRERFDPRGPRLMKARVHGISKHGFYIVITRKPDYVYVLKPDGVVIAVNMWTKNVQASADYAMAADAFWDNKDPVKKFYNSRPGYETWVAK